MSNRIDYILFGFLLFMLAIFFGTVFRSEYNLQRRLNEQIACWEQKNAMSEMRYWTHYQMGLPKELTIGEYAYRGIDY